MILHWVRHPHDLLLADDDLAQRCRPTKAVQRVLTMLDQLFGRLSPAIIGFGGKEVVGPEPELYICPFAGKSWEETFHRTVRW
jgi:hypothetical protein